MNKVIQFAFLFAGLVLSPLCGLLPATELTEPREVNAAPEPKAGSVLAFVGARLIDGRGGQPVENATVVVRGAKIESAGPADKVTVPREAQRIDSRGMSILPGLIDSHFHSKHDVIKPIEYELKHGITSFRDPGHPFRFYNEVRASEHTFPRVFLTGSHLDAYPPAHPDQAALITDADHARRTVHAHVDAGASAIKIYMRLPLEHIAAACEAAQERGVLVTAHLELIDADAAIRAGLRGIEHITSFGTTLADEAVAEKFKSVVGADSAARHSQRYWLWSTLDLENSPRVRPLLELIVRNDVFISPTLAVFERRAGEKGATEADAAGFANMVKFTGMCHRFGAKIVVGSHTSGPFAKPGWAYQREMELLQDAGMSPLEIITAATRNNAEFFGVAKRLGTIEPGKLADLVVVEGDPSKDLQAMRNVRHVVLNGVLQGGSR